MKNDEVSHPAKKKTGSSSKKKVGGNWITTEELTKLRDTLREAQDTLDAIRSGEVDAVVVSGSHGNQIYSLAGAEQPYRVYVEQMQEGAVTVSVDGLILYCNQRFAEMLNLPLEKVIGTSIIERLPSGVWQEMAEVFSQADGVVKHKSHLFGVNGRSLPVNLTASRLPLAEQDVICLVVTDLTSLKEQDEMRLAKEVAEAANVAKDAFLAALSHELRTPLTPALMSVIDLEQDMTLPDQVRQSAAMIRRNVELEVRLIDDLLDLTRIVRGKLELRLGPMDVHLVLKRALEICQPDIDAKRLRVDLQLLAEHTETLGDAVRLQQALWNVIRNAVKFTPAGGEIVIKTSNHGLKKVWLQVVDSGIGFESDTQNKLFRAFEQGSHQITRQFGGLGLGLSITRNIVESHGGVIEGESAGKGRGATFTIELPLVEALATDEGTALPKKPAKEPLKPKGLRILLVEDHKDTRLTLQRLLGRSGHIVSTASSGQEALGIASENYDIVISDLGLPDMSGHLLMKKLRDQHNLQGIAMSGYGMEEDVNQSLASGFSHHLTKPIQLGALTQLLEDLLEQKH